jgi:hypothetical protein
MEKRKVLFKKFIPKETIKHPTGCEYERLVKGTNCFEEGYSLKGTFHCWGDEITETDEEVASFTIGIVEKENGEIVSVAPDNIKFV